VGARPFLIAFNVNLRSNENRDCATDSARRARARWRLASVKALGFALHTRGLVQVSMNLTDYERTSIARAFEAVRAAAARRSVEIAGAEIVGLLPRAALDREASYFPLLEKLPRNVVLETLLEALKPTANRSS